MLALFTVLLMLDHQNLIMETEYQIPLDVLLSDPHFMDYSLSGELYLLERNDCRVHHWTADGKYLGSFGEKGEGPGQLSSPRLIHVTRDEVWVWDTRALMSIYDLEGKFIRTQRTPPAPIRRFAVVNKDLLLIAFQNQEKKGNMMYFALVDGEGKMGNVVKRFKNEMFLNQMKGDDHGRVKAYGPEIEIHSDKNGTILFGFSQEAKIYRLGPDGQIVSEQKYDFPGQPPTDEEREIHENLEVPGPDGQPITLKKLPGLSISYEYDKAFYTHLLAKNGKLAGILTPISGNDREKGYYRGSYHIMDAASGALLERGRYKLPEGSVLLYNNGRAIACLLDDEDLFMVRSVTLKGMGN